MYAPSVEPQWFYWFAGRIGLLLRPAQKVLSWEIHRDEPFERNWSWESNQTKSIMQGSHGEILSIPGPLNDISPSTSTLSCLHMPRLLSFAPWFLFFHLPHVLLFSSAVSSRKMSLFKHSPAILTFSFDLWTGMCIQVQEVSCLQTNRPACHHSCRVTRHSAWR